MNTCALFVLAILAMSTGEFTGPITIDPPPTATPGPGPQVSWGPARPPQTWPWSASLSDFTASPALPSITQTGSVIGLIQTTVSPLSTRIGTLNSVTAGQPDGNMGSIWDRLRTAGADSPLQDTLTGGLEGPDQPAPAVSLPLQDGSENIAVGDYLDENGSRSDQPAHAVSLSFQDGFEHVTVGDYPNENGWNILFDGKDAYVSDASAHGGTKSFRLNSYPNWAHMDYLYLGQVPDWLAYEVSIRVDPMYGHSALAGFMKAVGSQGPVWNYFWVSGDTGEVLFTGLDTTHMGRYTRGTWCTLRADIDFINQKADLWMNGNLVVEDVPIHPKEFDDPGWGHVVLNQWGVDSCNYSGGSDNVVYFDDVRLYEIGEATIDIKPGSGPKPINDSPDPIIIGPDPINVAL